METSALLKKYNVATPRYTSYPTVPYWDIENFTANGWLANVANTYESHKDEGISLYIHLPFCESLCTYCGCNTRITKNHGVEVPYIKAVLAEWKMYVEVLREKPKLKELHLGGGTPTFFSAENLKMLINGITKHAILAPGAEFSFEAHPANTTELHLTTLYKLGFRRLSLGIQDFDPKVQFLINRFQTPQQVAEVTAEAKKIGYTSVNFDLIYGLPGQTVNGLTDTIKQVIDMRPDRIAFYSYAHVPWLKPGQRHYSEEDIPIGDEKFALYQLGRQLLDEAGYKDVGMDHFALKTDSLFQAMADLKLHRNFMGYTNQHTRLLIGLGVSSISDSWTAFAQNPKTVESYLNKISQATLPVEKGHFLTGEDLEVRKHILNMICRENTSYNEGIPEPVYGRLLPLVKDKLVWVTEKEIRITTKGRSFLRNVCMAFDEKLWLKQPKTQLFSSSI
ncbi:MULTISPECIES: oxygen-independent coproporphyrinogen III oxidase [unclassified Pedobacter]|uniref:oxygen-independent coproporphyrinogen III oxidase n=1 Tax=unclassified Pedobacter TaxID=2628915 RepID=UPI001D31DE9D|nr:MULTISPECIES: oxygen-independent coproporphyrinogen III oxidase [unclassified Pedobacter]CAH0309255.1 Oxygen-independent coproporphyrinogen III oxidase [Pedobacter sp. Bi36]CAH0315777.1 Oxygen-independent coproporphyrinogen III oxidase [Pedobacter sp. Bi126]